MCEESIKVFQNSNMPVYNNVTNVVIGGVGGSSIAGVLVKDLLKNNFKQPMEIFSDYKLPKFANERTLCVCASYSGNTEETLAQFVDAMKKGCKMITITSGGKLEEWSRKFKVPMLLVPKGFVPRESLLYLFVPLALCFGRMASIDFTDDVKEGISVIKKINTQQIDAIAQSCLDKEISVYSSHDYAGIVRRFKNDLNETAKIPVMHHEFPEMDHNEIVAYENLELSKNKALILLRDKDESFEMKSRIKITKEIIHDSVASVNEIWAEGNSRMAKILSLVFKSGYLAGKLAELKGFDPRETKFIDQLKIRLKDEIGLVEKLEKEVEKLQTS